ncbi:MAG TPA: sugar ABC transporter substrate-binding protein, partial [Chloroflexota bacterium]
TLLRLLAATGATALLAACGSSSSTVATTSAAPAAGAKTAASAVSVASAAPSGTSGAALTAMAWGDVNTQKVMHDQIPLYERQHPGVKITYINTAGGNAHYQKLQTMMAGGDAPSVFYMDPSLMPSYATKGVLGVLDSYVQASHYDLTDFYPKAIGQYYWQGKLYGLPRGFGNQDLYWNQGLFQKAGIQPPGAQWDDPKWTTDAFLALADKLTVRSGGKVTQFGYGQSLGLRQWEPWVWLFGGEVVDQANQKCLLAEQPAMNGLQFLADLMHKYQVMPAPDYTQQQTNASMFASNRLGMNMDIPAALSTYRQLTTITWDVAPLPKQQRAVTSGGGICWAMYGKGPQPQAQWDLLSWLTGASFQTAETVANVTAPPRKSIADSPAYNDPKQPPKHMDVFLKAPDFVHTDPVSVNFNAVDTLIEKQLSYLWDGSKAARDVLPSLATQVDSLLKGQ